MGLGPHHPACPCFMCADRRVKEVYYSPDPEPVASAAVLANENSSNPLLSFDEWLCNSDYRFLADLRIRAG